MTAAITDAELLAYRGGQLDAESDAALEELLMVDPVIRARLASLASPDRLQLVWHRVENQLDVPAPGRLERFARRLGVPEPAARVAGATPALSRSWAIAIGLLALFSLVVSTDNGQPGDDRFLGYLILAPLILLTAVAAAYGRSTDPAHEIAIAAPLSGFRLLLWRVLAVAPTALVVNVAVGIVVGAGPLAFAWILPGIACTLTALALATSISIRRSAAIVATGWVVLAAVVAAPVTDKVIMFRAGGQLLALVAAIIAGSVLLLRRDRLEAAVQW